MKKIILIAAAFLLLVSCSGPSYSVIYTNQPKFSADMVGLRNIMLDLPAGSKIAIADADEAASATVNTEANADAEAPAAPVATNVAANGIPEESKRLMKSMLEAAGFKVVSKSEADVVITGKTEYAGLKSSRLILRALKVNNGEQISLSRTYSEELFTTARTQNVPNVLSIADGRDGQTYNINKIGNLAWMSQNLNYSTGERKCFDNDESNCKVYYGSLYNWDDAQNVCPNGWRLPTKEEWKEMVNVAKGNSNEGFVVDYDIYGSRTFWTASESNKTKANYVYMNHFYWVQNANKTARVYFDVENKNKNYSVRCVRAL